MCPGGFVVNSSSEQGGLVVNGMSNHARDEENANSALIVTVTPEDFPKANDIPEALSGIEYQRILEKAAYKTGKGVIPVQLFGDLCRNQENDTIGHIKPIIKGQYTFANLRECLPDYITDTLIEGVQAFDKRYQGLQTRKQYLQVWSPEHLHLFALFVMNNMNPIYPAFIHVEKEPVMQVELLLQPWMV